MSFDPVLASSIDAEGYRNIIDIERQIYETQPYKFQEAGVRGVWSYDDDDYVWFTVKKTGRVVAYALIDVERPFVYLDDLAVSPLHQGKGLAKQILRRVVEWMNRDGRRIFLKVATNNKKAIKLYESAGFALTDETQKPNIRIDPGHVFMHLDS